jgi:hypothetical protein
VLFDSLFPALDIGLIEKQMTCCGLGGEPQVFRVQVEVSNRLDAPQQTAGPAVAIVESAGHKKVTTVSEKVWGVVRVAGVIGRGGSGEVQRRGGGLELVEVGAGAAPERVLVGAAARHGYTVSGWR